jgi:ABC-2 type transport system ATP-binding protein
MPELVLEARGLQKRYKSVHAVRGIDVTVARGERVGLLGPNGAGKTTTLLMLLGVVSPDAGEITVAGHRLPRGRSRAMGGVGFAAGYLPLPERLRVRETLEVFAGWYGILDVRGAVERGLERFGVGHLADRMAEELSSGQRTLVGIVKATLHEPDLLVLDEPTASLDPDIALRVRTGLLAVCRDLGTALLVTSHDMREVELLTERVVFLAHGQVIADASAAEIAATFGHDDLEGVFLEIADQHRDDPAPVEHR